MSGITIIDAKVIGICSKCRKEGDEIPRYKDGTIVEDKDISCINEALGGDCKNKLGTIKRSIKETLKEKKA